MDRKDLLAQAKMLGIPAKGKNIELQAAINDKIEELNGLEDDMSDVYVPSVKEEVTVEELVKEVNVAPKAQMRAKGGDIWAPKERLSPKGYHPITGKPVK